MRLTGKESFIDNCDSTEQDKINRQRSVERNLDDIAWHKVFARHFFQHAALHTLDCAHVRCELLDPLVRGPLVVDADKDSYKQQGT